MRSKLQGVHPVLASSDLTASVEFYRGLGFVLSFQDNPDQPKYVGVARDGVEIHLQWADSEQWAYPTDRPAYRFVVTDVDAIYEEFVEGGMINSGTSQDSPWAAPYARPEPV